MNGIVISFDESTGMVSLGSPKKANRESKGKSLLLLLDDYIALDIETTGLSPDFDDIIEVAAVRYSGGKEIDRFQSLINPHCDLSAFIVELTGITSEMVQQAPDLEVVLPKFRQFLGDSPLVGHNINFDINFLYDRCVTLSLPYISNDFVDTMRLSRKLYPDWENHRLATMIKNLNVGTSVEHRALSDCIQTAQSYEILKQYAKEINADLSMSDNTQKRARLSKRTEKVNELLVLLSSVSADGALTESEIQQLVTWLAQHEYLRGEYQFDEVYNAISSVLDDGYIDSDERSYLLTLCRTLTDPAGNLESAGKIEPLGKSFCLTGNFDYGSKAEVEAFIEAKGGTISPRVVRTLDYLIVGGQGSTAWASGNYGTKVKKALEFNSKGACIQIVRESDIFDPVCGGV